MANKECIIASTIIIVLNKEWALIDEMHLLTSECILQVFRFVNNYTSVYICRT